VDVFRQSMALLFSRAARLPATVTTRSDKTLTPAATLAINKPMMLDPHPRRQRRQRAGPNRKLLEHEGGITPRWVLDTSPPPTQVPQADLNRRQILPTITTPNDLINGSDLSGLVFCPSDSVGPYPDKSARSFVPPIPSQVSTMQQFETQLVIFANGLSRMAH